MKDFFQRVFNLRCFPIALYFFSILLLFLLIFICKINYVVYILFWLVGFGWTLYFLGKRLNIVEHIMVSPIISICLFVFYIVLCSFLGINLTISLGIIFIILSSCFFFCAKVFQNKNINWKITRLDLLLLSLILIAIVSKISSVTELQTPNPSDEITHAYYAKTIVDTGKIAFFYSPGIHIIFAYSNMFNGQNIAKQVLYITNFLSAYSGVAIYMYIKHVFKDRIAAIVVALLFSLGIALSFFFYSAGKNALVAGISILPLFFYVLHLDQEGESAKGIILSSILIFALFIIHYPLAVFASIYLVCIYVLNFSEGKKSQIFIFSGVILGLIYLLKGYLKYNINELLLPNNHTEPTLYAILLSSKNYLLYIVSQARAYAFRSYPLILFLMSFLGLLYACRAALKSKLKVEYRALLAWTFCSFILGGIISIFSISKINIILETYILSLFIFSYIYLSFSVSYLYSLLAYFINRKKLFYIFTIIFVVIATFLGMKTFQTFEEKKKTSIVKEQDLSMFEWIDSNIQDNEGIITNGYVYSELILPADSGGWLPIFTGNRISTPFWEFSFESTYTNFEYYKKLQEDVNHCGALNYFKNEGFRYYFQGSTFQFNNWIATREILEANGWTLMHVEGNSYLFKIPVCE